jgi:lysine-specific demethylase/histidyl-hydroxylase NO66
MTFASFSPGASSRSPGRASVPELRLEQLVGDVEAFFRSYRDQAPLLVHRALEDPAELFGLSDVDALLASEAIRPPYIGVCRDGRAVPEGEYTRVMRIQGRPVTNVVDTSLLLAQVEAGATITWYALPQIVPDFRLACASLSAALTGSSDALLFLTPERSQGFRVHVDPLEVFVVQLHGSKAWRVWPPLRPRPLVGRELPSEPLGPAALEAELTPGDVLYLPWGAPHAAAAGDATSMHLSFTVKPQRWHDLLIGAVSHALAARPDEDELPSLESASLPDELRERLRLLGEQLEQLDTPTVLAQMFAEAQGTVGELEYLGSRTAQAAPVTAATALVRRAPLSLAAADDDGRIRFEVNHHVYSLPSAARGALRHVATNERLRAGDLAVGISETQALRLARRLVGIGLLRVEGP